MSPDKKKPASESTSDELLERIFPKEAKDKLKEIAHEGPKKRQPKPKKK